MSKTLLIPENPTSVGKSILFYNTHKELKRGVILYVLGNIIQVNVKGITTPINKSDIVDSRT